MSDAVVNRKPKKGLTDEFANIAYKRLTMSGANTLTFEPVSFAVGLFQGVAILINRILYTPLNAAIRELVAATDHLDMAVVTSNRIAGLDPGTDPAIVDVKRITCVGINTEPFHLPFITDLTGMPGGGKLCGANPLFIAAESGGFAAAAIMDVQLEFQFLQLGPAQYLELIQAQFPANIV